MLTYPKMGGLQNPLHPIPVVVAVVPAEPLAVV